MDKITRNAIERATQRARKLLEEDFAAQLEGTYDISRSGTIAPEGGPHLSVRQKVYREKLVVAIEHKEAAGMKTTEAIADYIRDVAFTTLNRFAALKMLEARDLVQECISRGEQSSGYKELCGLAPGMLLLPDSAGYQIYIESIFDELATEVKVLFDRRDAASILWPRRATFEELLALLNVPELTGVWSEDETIGWIYQYFNSGEERRAMRDASQVPRNSRELAVRNQFFTPSYVVRFLTDNTLGRIWYEMRGGSTQLGELCEYMVRCADEVLLQSGDGGFDAAYAWFTGESGPAPDPVVVARTVNAYHRHGPPQSVAWSQEILDCVTADGVGGISTQDLLDLLCMIHRTDWFSEGFADGCQPEIDAIMAELAQRIGREGSDRPTFVQYRQRKDPRDIRLLDPACGSGHFLLYAFALFLLMYEEAWSDVESPGSEITGRTLQQDYPALHDLHGAIPSLILRHNLYGVDIDPRCAQIAQLALWMRAQRAWRDSGVARGDRAPIRRMNIVIAEPMPGELDMIDEVAGTLDPPLLGDLFRRIVEELKLAGELGLLLRTEVVLKGAVEKARDEYRRWQNKMPHGYLPGLEPDRPQGELDFRGIDDERFFETAEAHILEALRGFGEHAIGSDRTRRSLFIEDAAQGLGLIELPRQKYDVVLMNPPFGAGSNGAKKEFEKMYPRTKYDIYAAFVERGIELLDSRSRLGAITSRTGFFLSSFQKWREEIILTTAPPIVFADLGAGVLDSAMVETAAYCLEAAV